jgi:MFS superfamily sulfate permease-like transporter
MGSSSAKPHAAAPNTPLGNLPQDGLRGLSENWKTDLVSGLLVSLIALPLCLGIAMASGFPAFGGVVTAIVGGVIVGPLSGSRLTIKGPAAGLIAIVIASVETLGQGDMGAGYRYTLAVIVAASVIQVVFAVCKLGRFADFFPASVVHGMLAAIGIIILSKQVHPLLGVKPTAREPIPLLFEMPHSLVVMNPEVALVGVVSIAIVIFAASVLGRLARFFPGPLIAVAAGIGLCLYFDFKNAHTYSWYSQNYTVDQRYLVSLPASFFDGVTLPDFSKLFSAESLQFLALFALIGSLESLLTCKAIDGLDPYQRKSNMDRDLGAVGIGNFISGMCGGLPMIAEVVRSSANISYGAKTRWANFFHGTCLLLFVVLLAPVIQLIPNAVLAGVLCVVGYRLASPRHFRECKEIGREQLLVFVITIVATLLTDLLMGVAIGMASEYVISAMLGAPVHSLFSSVPAAVAGADGRHRLVLPEACIFGNVVGFKRRLAELKGKPATLDFSGAAYVDHTFMHEVYAAEREHDLQIVGLDRLTPLSLHREAARRTEPRKSALLTTVC